MAGRLEAARARVYRAVDALEDRQDSLVRSWRRRLGLVGPIVVVPYRGWGRPDQVWLTGRVLERLAPAGARSADRWWRNVRATLQRVASREVPGVELQLTIGGCTARAVSDNDGYYAARVDRLTLAAGWHSTQVEPVAPPAHATGRRWSSDVLVVPEDAPLGVVSDLDDTVLHSGVTNLLVAARTVLLDNAATRVPWPGVGALYRGLAEGAQGRSPAGTGAVPVFYLSTSPWNLYDLLTEFLDRHRLPRGPMFLMDWGLSHTGLLRGHDHGHKRERLETLFATYPRMRLVLVGDSGQRDAEIYRDAARAHPGRVAAVVVRDVTPPDSARARAVHSALGELGRLDVAAITCADTSDAAVFLIGLGLCHPSTVEKVRAARDDDRRHPH